MTKVWMIAAVLMFTGDAALVAGGYQSMDVLGPMAGMRPGIDSSAGERTPEVRRFVGRGDALVARRHYAAAEQEFLQAISTARRQGHLSSLTSWRLASGYYFEGRLEEAARTLDELAVEASGFGDLGIEARALFNSAWLYGEAHKGIEASTRLAKLKKLLQSPYMPVAVRDALLERLSAPAFATNR